MSLIRGTLLYLVTTFELNVPMEENIVDIGWQLTRPIHSFLRRNPAFRDKLVLYNTAVWGSCLIYINSLYFIGHNTKLMDKCLKLYILRAFTGTMTRLPVSQEMLTSENDIPPSEHNFFFFFSGHTFIMYLVTMELYANNNIFWGHFMMANLVLQTLRLLAMRGHYSIDIIMACVLSHCF